jgi:hypothetical protein
MTCAIPCGFSVSGTALAAGEESQIPCRHRRARALPLQMSIEIHCHRLCRRTQGGLQQVLQMEMMLAQFSAVVSGSDSQDVL